MKLLTAINGKIGVMDDKLSEVIHEMKETKAENQKMRDIISSQEERIASLEKEVRRRNLIFRGVEDGESEETGETKRKIVMICQTLGVVINPETNIDEIKRLGSPRPGASRPVLIKLTTNDKKWEILKKAKGLKGTNIWIDEDYPKRIQEERKLLIPELKKARVRGQHAKLRYNKLIIDGKEVGANDVNTSEPVLRGNTVANKRKTDMRSPEAAKLEEQLRKISRTAKNGHE